MHELLTTALDAAAGASRLLLDYFGRRDLDVQVKEANDFVSEADTAAEAAILGTIRQRHPGHAILSEETGWSGVDDGDIVWVVDPLDGTTNFLHGLPVWAVSIACLKERVPQVGVIAEPVTGKVFSARRGEGAHDSDGRRLAVSGRSGLEGSFLATGFPFKAKAALPLYLEIFAEAFRRGQSIRRTGAAALDLAYTAAGTYDGFFEFKLSPWDLAAGALLIEEAGGCISDLDGGADFLESGSVLAGSPGTWQALVDLLAGLGGEAAVAHELENDRRQRS